MRKDDSLIDMDVEGLEESVEEVKRGLDKAGNIAFAAAKAEMVNIVFDLLGEAMRKAPVKEGTLRGSGIAKVNNKQVGHTESTGEGSAQLIEDFKTGKISLQDLLNEITGEVAFNTRYATIQHEEQSFNHPRGGEAKYLENPLKEKSPEYVKGLAEAIRQALDKRKW